MPLPKDVYRYDVVNPKTLQQQIEETNRRFRENQIKLLTEFVDYTISKGYGSAYSQRELIESFLDQREIKWEQKIGEVSISHKEDE